MLALALLIGSLHGVVMRGPITPVCMVGKPCDAPAAHLRLEFVRNGRSFATTTDANGRFRIRLPVGTYAVMTLPVPTVGRGVEPRSVRVVAHRDTRVDFHVDTGIR